VAVGNALPSWLILVFTMTADLGDSVTLIFD
jgi:hypothetical protein